MWGTLWFLRAGSQRIVHALTLQPQRSTIHADECPIVHITWNI
jgi:hypothetical protein